MNRREERKRGPTAAAASVGRPAVGTGGVALRRALSLVAVVLLLLLPTPSCVPEPGAPERFLWRAQCEPESSAAVGDPIQVTLEGQWPDSIGSLTVAWRLPEDSLLILHADSAAAAAPTGWAASRHRVTFVAPRAGDLRIPPAALVSPAGDTLALTRPHRLAIHSQIRSADDAQLAPLAPMVSLRGFPWWLLPLAGGLLAALVIRSLWRRRRRSRAAAEAEPEVPPLEEFDSALRALLDRSLAERGRMRLLIQELSWILRRYLGRRWQHPALEATRPEIVRWLPQTDLEVRDQHELAAWLEETDRVKFAGQRPLLAEAERLVARARAMVARMEEMAHAAERALEVASEDESVANRARGGSE